MSGSSDEPTPCRAAVLSTICDAPINILIVDDEPKNLTVLETVLDRPGLPPGARRVRRPGAARPASAEEFALLILDIRMPGMTGFELAQMIKERKKTARVPIIFLTAYYNEDQHVLEGYGSGAVDYLHKPVNPAILRSKVAVFAELYRKSREIDVCQPRAARRGDRAPPRRGAAARAEREPRPAASASAPARWSSSRPSCARPSGARTSSSPRSPTSCAIRWRRCATPRSCCSTRRTSRRRRARRATSSPARCG